jgi:hypothetical protein
MFCLIKKRNLEFEIRNGGIFDKPNRESQGRKVTNEL